MFVRAHLLMTRLVLYPANTPETFIKSTKVALKKVIRSLQLEIDTAMMLEMECVFVKNPHFEFLELYKQMVGPYQSLIDQSVLTYLAEKLEIESELHTTMQTSQISTKCAQVDKKINKKRKNPFMNVNDGIDALSLRSQVSQTSKLSDMSIASLFDKKEELRRPSKILKIRRA